MIEDRVLDSARLRDLEQQHFAKVLSRSSDLFVERGLGSYLYTTDGRRILDFAMGIAAVNTGHSHPRVIEAAKAQIDKVVHPSATAVRYAPNIELVASLASITPGDLDVTFLANSGAEAVEASLKLAKYVTQRPAIIAFSGGFHGRTMGALSVTSSKAHYRERYEPLMPSTYFAPFPYSLRCPLGHQQDTCCSQCISYLERQFERSIDPHSVAAMLVEPVQGEGGYIIPPAQFLKDLRALCDRYGILLIFDEVQSGFGRTGRWWASEHFAVIPDIQVMAKGIASGFPLSAISSTRQLMDAWHPGAHGSTFGGNPVSCAAACATIAAIQDEGMIENARTVGAFIVERLRDLQRMYPVIGEVRGLGMMIAVEFVMADGKGNTAMAAQVQRRCIENNLLVLTCGPYDQNIRFMPPLNLTLEEAEEGLGIFAAALEAARAG